MTLQFYLLSYLEQFQGAVSENQDYSYQCTDTGDTEISAERQNRFWCSQHAYGDNEEYACDSGA